MTLLALAPVGQAAGPRCFGKKATQPTRTPPHTTFGTGGNDVIIGTPGKDEIHAGNGNDLICGRGGKDQIDGGKGFDELSGGGQRDKLKAGTLDDPGTQRFADAPGVNFLDGGSGDDVITGGDGNDEIDGDDGEDRIEAGDAGDLIEGGDEPGQLGDTIQGGLGQDAISGQEGNDNISETDVIAPGTSGPDENFILGGPGDDLIVGSNNPEDLSGGPGRDDIHGSDGNDRISGGDGDDNEHGGAGDDEISGEGGNDLLLGETANDKLDGGPDTDDCDPGGEQGDAEPVNCEDAYDLRTTVTEPSDPAPSGQITYSFVVANAGPDLARNVTVVLVPTATSSPPPTCSSFNTGVVNLGDIPANQFASGSHSVTCDGPGEIKVEATAVGFPSAAEFSPSDNVNTETTTISGQATPANVLFVDFEFTGVVPEGEFTWPLDVTNRSDNPPNAGAAEGVQVDFVIDTTPGLGATAHSSCTPVPTMSLGDIALGATVQVDVPLTCEVANEGNGTGVACVDAIATGSDGSTGQGRDCFFYVNDDP